MIDWLSKKRREQKRKEAEEQKLRASLSEKLARYEESQKKSTSAAGADDHTEMTVNGKNVISMVRSMIDLQ